MLCYVNLYAIKCFLWLKVWCCARFWCHFGKDIKIYQKNSFVSTAFPELQLNKGTVYRYSSRKNLSYFTHFNTSVRSSFAICLSSECNLVHSGFLSLVLEADFFFSCKWYIYNRAPFSMRIRWMNAVAQIKFTLIEQSNQYEKKYLVQWVWLLGLIITQNNHSH